MRDLPSKSAAQENPMDDSATPRKSDQAAMERDPKLATTETGAINSEVDRRQAAALEAFLAQQRAAMGFT